MVAFNSYPSLFHTLLFMPINPLQRLNAPGNYTPGRKATATASCSYLAKNRPEVQTKAGEMQARPPDYISTSFGDKIFFAKFFRP
jgi:hypothetical protein